MIASPPKSGSLYELFLRFNRRLLWLIHELRPEISVNESHLLADICAGQGKSVAQLASNLRLNKSTISRHIHTLVKESLVERAISSHDRRRQVVHLSLQGQELVARDAQKMNEVVRRCVDPLSQAQQERLRGLLKGIADDLHSAMVNPRPDDHPIKREIRRLTRSMGFIGPVCMNTGLAVEECQVLSLCAVYGPWVPLSIVKQQLPYEMSMLSRLVSALAQSGFLQKRTNAHDERRVEIGLTAAGCERHRQNALRGEDFVSRALPGKRQSAVKHLRDLLQRFVDTPRELPVSSGIKIKYSLLRTKEARSEARVFVVEQMLRNQRGHELHEEIIGRHSRSFALHLQDRLIGVCELQARGKEWVLAHCVITYSEPTTVLQPLLKVLQKAHVAKVIIPYSLPESELFKGHGIGQATSEGIAIRSRDLISDKLDAKRNNS